MKENKEGQNVKNDNENEIKMNESEKIEMKVCEDKNINNTDRDIDSVANQKRKRQCRSLSKLERKQLKMKKQQDTKVKKKEIINAEKKEKATLISNERLLTDDDFLKIDTALAKQQITYAKRGIKRDHPTDNEHGDFVKLADIENIYKKRKYDKQARVESVKVCVLLSLIKKI